MELPPLETFPPVEKTQRLNQKGCWRGRALGKAFALTATLILSLGLRCISKTFREKLADSWYEVFRKNHSISILCSIEERPLPPQVVEQLQRTESPPTLSAPPAQEVSRQIPPPKLKEFSIPVKQTHEDLEKRKELHQEAKYFVQDILEEGISAIGGIHQLVAPDDWDRNFLVARVREDSTKEVVKKRRYFLYAVGDVERANRFSGLNSALQENYKGFHCNTRSTVWPEDAKTLLSFKYFVGHKPETDDVKAYIAEVEIGLNYIAEKAWKNWREKGKEDCWSAEIVQAYAKENQGILLERFKKKTIDFEEEVEKLRKKRRALLQSPVYTQTP